MHVQESFHSFEMEMVHGWLDGIQSKYYDSIEEIRSEVLISRPHRGQPAGDIDALVLFSEGFRVRLRSLFPARLITRPCAVAEANPIVPGVFAEVKRSVSAPSLKGKIRHFINFYSELLSLVGLKASSLMGSRIDRCSHLLFVYNGVDSVAVGRTMRNELMRKLNTETFEICGKPIVVIWAGDTDICLWGRNLRSEQLLAQGKQQLAVMRRQIAQFESLLGRKRVFEVEAEIEDENEDENEGEAQGRGPKSSRARKKKKSNG